MYELSEKHDMGKIIARLRKEKGWTQVNLAEKLQVSDKAVSKWENDSGAPSIEFLPVLADLFGVSIEYLLTGKERKEEVVVTSKTEYCAKTDDVSMLKDIDVSYKDENGKTLGDYVAEYESIKVYNACNSLRMSVKDNIKMALISNNIDRLRNISIDSVCWRNVDIRDCAAIKEKHIYRCDMFYAVLPDEIFELIACDKRITDETFNFLISRKDNGDLWYLGIPYLIHKCYIHNQKTKVEKLLSVSIENNKEVAKLAVCKYAHYNIVQVQDDSYVYDDPSIYRGIIVVLEETIKEALTRGGFEMTEILNSINRYFYSKEKYMASDDEIRIAKLKFDNKLSPSEIKVQEAIHNGILNLEELKKVDSVELVKRAIKEYPIDIFELLFDLLKENKWEELSRYSEKNNRFLANYIADKNYDEILKWIVSDWKRRHSHDWKHKYSDDIHQAAEEISAVIEEIKKDALINMSFWFEMNKITDELTKNYFETELSKGNVEMVIIKLCVRLEAYLKNYYHSDDDFAELLNRYCDDDKPEILHKLRIQRNSIVHAEKTVEPMTLDEIRFCINYICNMVL